MADEKAKVPPSPETDTTKESALSDSPVKETEKQKTEKDKETAGDKSAPKKEQAPPPARRQQRYQTDKRRQDCYICGSYKKRTADCTAHFIRTDLLTGGVTDNLRKVTSYAAKHEARFMKLLTEQTEDGRKRRNAARKKELEAAEKRIAELSAIFKRLYEDSVAGRISDERFTELSVDYEAEQKELKEKAAALQGGLSRTLEATANAEKFMKVVRKYTIGNQKRKGKAQSRRNWRYRQEIFVVLQDGYYNENSKPRHGGGGGKAGQYMYISYKPLWHTLIERNMRKEDLRLAAGLTTNMIANMGKGKHISMETLTKICEALNCGILDVIELEQEGD